MDINDLVGSTITVGSVTASQSSFGVPAVLAQFPAGTKGFAASGPGSRTQYYSSTAGMLAAGWLATDAVLQAASAVFKQNPHASQIMVGRIDAADGSAAFSGAAINGENSNWYTFSVVGFLTGKFTLSTDLITGNSIASTVNGQAIAPVVFTSSHATTMAAWLTAIQAVFPTATGVVSGDTLTITIPNQDVFSITATVTLGASQPATSISYSLTRASVTPWMDWAETAVKISLWSDSDPAQYAAPTGVVGTACLGEYAKLKGYRRTVVIYHQTPGEYAQFAAPGLELGYTPGLRTWAFKSYAGVSPDILTSPQDESIRAKNINVYTTVYGPGGSLGVSFNYAGTCAAAQTFIDDVRGTDWLNSKIQTDQLNLSIANPRIPFNDAGIQLRVETLRGSLKAAQANTILNPEVAPVITYPKAADVSPTDKGNRVLNNVSWSASYAGSIQNVNIIGSISFPMN